MITSNPRKFSLKEVAEFNGKDGKPAYLIYRGVVYDVTNYLERHPGGKKILFEYAGRDCTKDFDDMDHTNEAFSEMNKLKIGEVKEKRKKEKLTISLNI